MPACAATPPGSRRRARRSDTSSNGFRQTQAGAVEVGMVVLNKIYTRTGDDGSTALGTGERRPKYDLRIEAYGTVDETNAALGMARAELDAGLAELDALLEIVRAHV